MSAVTVVTMIASFARLSVSMKTLPLGAAHTRRAHSGARVQAGCGAFICEVDAGRLSRLADGGDAARRQCAEAHRVRDDAARSGRRAVVARLFVGCAHGLSVAQHADEHGRRWAPVWPRTRTAHPCSMRSPTC